MKQVIFILLCAAAGFFTSILTLKGIKGSTFNFDDYAEPIQTSLLVIIFILLLISLVKYRSIKKLHKIDVTGDEEDEADALIYKKFTDYTLFTQSSIILSLLTLCISVITTQNVVFMVLGIVAIVISYLTSILTNTLIKLVYPDRNIPSASERNFTEKFLAISDEGERHVMLIGFYKSYYVVSIALIVAIILATFYSVWSGKSQLFSIIVMSIVLLLTHGKYCMAIRNK